jgi:hypothetical protein
LSRSCRTAAVHFPLPRGISGKNLPGSALKLDRFMLSECRRSLGSFLKPVDRLPTEKQITRPDPPDLKKNVEPELFTAQEACKDRDSNNFTHNPNPTSTCHG